MCAENNPVKVCTGRGISTSVSQQGNLIMPLWLLCFFMWLTLSYGCNVEVRKPFHPMYVQVGRQMELTCVVTNCVDDTVRLTLEWWRQTVRSQWSETKIIPTKGAGWMTRNLQVEPSGYTESKLIKERLELSDRGWYLCKDSENINSYSIWVTTLKILHTADIQLIESSTNDLTLVCNITGLDSNIPHIEYVWYFGDLEVVNVTDRFTLGEASNARMSLTIHKPRRADGGTYKCAFILGTNLGPVTFTEGISVNADAIEVSRTSSVVPLMSVTVLVQAAVTILTTLNTDHL